MNMGCVFALSKAMTGKILLPFTLKRIHDVFAVAIGRF